MYNYKSEHLIYEDSRDSSGVGFGFHHVLTTICMGFFSPTTLRNRNQNSWCFVLMCKNTDKSTLGENIRFCPI